MSLTSNSIQVQSQRNINNESQSARQTILTRIMSTPIVGVILTRTPIACFEGCTV